MALSSDPEALWSSAAGGDVRAIARVLSIVEDGRPGDRVILAKAHRRWSTANTVGVTGAPGAGKSTLTNALITRFRAAHERVGVVAVDPSSPFTGGAILGDRIRMQDHVSDIGVFVRSMSSRGRLGGLANGTAKIVTVLSALGYDPIAVETVGVGQSEVEVMELTDTVIVVVTPGMGDGIQAAKAGLLEVGDIFVVNKADLPGAAEVVRDLAQMLELGTTDGWNPPIVSTTAHIGEGVDDVAEAIASHQRYLGKSGLLQERRRSRVERTLKRAVLEALSDQIDTNGIAREVIDRVMRGELDPWTAAEDAAT